MPNLTAQQQIIVTPLNAIDMLRVFRQMEKEILFLAFKQINVPKDKFLSIDLSEENGERRMIIKIKHRVLVLAHECCMN